MGFKDNQVNQYQLKWILNSLSKEEIKLILENYRTIAIVGLSRNPAKYSYGVAQYLQSVGYRIIPVNPFAKEIMGEQCYKSLLDIPEIIEVVDIFRPSEDVPAIVEEAIELRKRLGNPKIIWMQLGIINKKAAYQARVAGFTIVMDHCMMVEHKRLRMEDALDS